MIPERLLRILRSCESQEASHFPATEVFNEGWMLRLVLDSMQTLGITSHPLRFLDGATWYSEALLRSRFRPRRKQDPLGEGFTNADGVIGHFEFRASTKTGLHLLPHSRQFVVVEAKMFSNLSSGTKNAPGFNQAARNVACMAEAISQSRKSLRAFEALGLFVVAPALAQRSNHETNLESCLDPQSIVNAVHQRIAAYGQYLGEEEKKHFLELVEWEETQFRPLVDRLVHMKSLRVLSWDDCIESIRIADAAAGNELDRFYRQCLSFAPPSPAR